MEKITPPDHVDIGIGRLTSYFQDKEDFISLITILLEELQEASDALVELSEIKNLDVVTGIWLDYIGQVLGESRKGRADEVYRNALKLRIAINTSDGTPDTIYDIIKIYTDSDNVRIAQGMRDYGQIIFDGTQNDDLSLYELLQEIIPVSTNVEIIQNTEGKCFFPAYRWDSIRSELFEVFTQGATETLNVILSQDTEGNFTSEPLYVNQDGSSNTYDPDTISSPFLAWVSKRFEPFYFSTGELFEITIDGVSSPFQVSLSDEDPEEIYLPWEIDKDSKLKVES